MPARKCSAGRGPSGALPFEEHRIRFSGDTLFRLAKQQAASPTFHFRCSTPFFSNLSRYQILEL